MTPMILHTRLCLGGVWYNRNAVVRMNDKDAQDYAALNMARKPTPLEIAMMGEEKVEQAPEVETPAPENVRFSDHTRRVVTKETIRAGKDSRRASR